MVRLLHRRIPRGPLRPCVQVRWVGDRLVCRSSIYRTAEHEVDAPLTAGLLQPVAADARLADGKRHWLDRLYQRISATQESGQAREVGADLARRYPQDTSVQFSYLPVLRALEALNEGDPARAFEIAQGEAPYNVAMAGTAFFAGGAFFGALYPGYLRGLACSRLARPSDAAAEFQTVLDQPGLVLNDPIGAIARLQLARALSACGDRAKSAATYADLLGLWKDAGADIPAVTQAKAEYAELHQFL